MLGLWSQVISPLCSLPLGSAALSSLKALLKKKSKHCYKNLVCRQGNFTALVYAETFAEFWLLGF